MVWGGLPTLKTSGLPTGVNEKHCMVAVCKRSMRLPRTEKIVELSLSWMRPGLEHRGFSQPYRFLSFNQDLRLEITCHPSAVIRGLHCSSVQKWHAISAHREDWRNFAGSNFRLDIIKLNAPTSGCTNISTMIDIIEWSFAGQIRNYLSSNHNMSEEKSPFCSIA